MPNQHSATRKAATFRFPRELLAAAQAEAKRRGETLTDVVIRALREYVTPQPPK